MSMHLPRRRHYRHARHWWRKAESSASIISRLCLELAATVATEALDRVMLMSTQPIAVWPTVDLDAALEVAFRAGVSA